MSRRSPPPTYDEWQNGPSVAELKRSARRRRRSGSRPRWAPRGEWFSRRRVSERRAQSARNRPLRRVWPVTSFFRVDPSTPVRVEISTAGGAPIALATLGDITE